MVVMMMTILLIVMVMNVYTYTKKCVDNDDGGNDDDDSDDGLLSFIVLHRALQPHIQYSLMGWRNLGGGIGFQGMRSCRADGEASLF